MKNIIIIAAVFMLLTCGVSNAKIRIAAAYPYIADIAEKIGKEKVEVKTLAPGNWDPHFVPAKPSLIAKVRTADLLISNGAELEIGWLPPVVRESRNSKVTTGSRGFLELSEHIKLVDIPADISRAKGDVHPFGNPHFILDPVNITIISAAVSDRLAEIDPANADYYKKNLAEFGENWKKKLVEWEKAMSPFKGSRIVQYHKLFNYFFKRYGLTPVMELEPLPGIAPTSGHIYTVIETVKAQKIKHIFNDVYHPVAPALLVSEKTGAGVIVLPHDVGAVKEAGDIISLFDEIIRRITK